MRPIIGLPVASRVSQAPGGRQVFELGRPYVRALVEAGASPVLLPACSTDPPLLAALPALDGLLLPGGVDIHPRYFGEAEHAHLGRVNPEADALELGLARWAADIGLPTLGICRGQQVLNVALGGSLYQDLPSQVPLCLGHQRTDQSRDFLAHSVRTAPDSRLAEIVGCADLQANSLHHQAAKECGAGLRAVGWAPDGVIEAIESPTHRFLVAVQFHPEELWPEHRPARALFLAFVAACAQYRKEQLNHEAMGQGSQGEPGGYPGAATRRVRAGRPLAPATGPGPADP